MKNRNILKTPAFWFFPVLCLTLLLCSCTQRAVSTPEDELKVNSWKGSGEYCTTVYLSFNETKASLDIHSMGGAETRFYGDCEVGDSKIYLTDSRLKKSLEFDYEIEGDKMTLSYDGGTINLVKAQ